MAFVAMFVLACFSGCTVYQYKDSWRRNGKAYIQDGVRIRHLGPITVVQVNGRRGTAAAAEWRMRNSGIYSKPSKRFPMRYTEDVAAPVATVPEE
jgi:hypothetical protein